MLRGHNRLKAMGAVIIRFHSGCKSVKKGEKDANTPTSITGRTRPVGCSKTGGGQQQNNPSSLHLWRVQGVGLK